MFSFSSDLSTYQDNFSVILSLEQFDLLCYFPSCFRVSGFCNSSDGANAGYREKGKAYGVTWVIHITITSLFSLIQSNRSDLANASWVKNH